jgi:hypothetical protein
MDLGAGRMAGQPLTEHLTGIGIAHNDLGGLRRRVHSGNQGPTTI